MAKLINVQLITTPPTPEEPVAHVDFRSARWRKSNVSGETGCVEVAVGLPMVGVRDTKDNGAGPILAFSHAAWTTFIEGLTSGEFTPDRIPS